MLWLVATAAPAAELPAYFKPPAGTEVVSDSLVEETYGVRPPFGIVVLAGGTGAKVSFTPDVERRLLRTKAQMRELVATQAKPGPRRVAPKCQACSFVETCWE